MHSALAGLVGHGSPALAFALIIAGGFVAFRSWAGIALAAIGVVIVPWHYLGYAALIGIVFAVLLFASSFPGSSSSD